MFDIGSPPSLSVMFGVWTNRLRYHSALPPAMRTPCNMPSPKNQWSDLPEAGFGPVRT